LWRDKHADEAAQTFKKLLSCIMLRRTKVILDLPARIDQVVDVSFDKQEEAYYRRVELPVAELLDQYTSNSWPTAIQQINKLRLICNLGIYMSHQSSMDGPMAMDGSLQATLVLRLSMGEDTCTQCLGPISLPSTDDDGLGRAQTLTSNTYYSACGQLYCAACTLLLASQSPSPCGCTDGTTSCRLLPLSSSMRTPRMTPTRGISPNLDHTCDDIKVSSKVRALIEQIQSCPTEKQ
jgi:hypothetical protein